MKALGQYLAKDITKKKGQPNSRHGVIMEDVMRFMGEDPSDGRRFRYWCGRTSGISYQDIYRFMAEAKEGRVPRALFQHKLKQEKERLKQQLVN